MQHTTQYNLIFHLKDQKNCTRNQCCPLLPDGQCLSTCVRRQTGHPRPTELTRRRRRLTGKWFRRLCEPIELSTRIRIRSLSETKKFFLISISTFIKLSIWITGFGSVIVEWFCFFITYRCSKMTLLWCHFVCSSILGKREVNTIAMSFFVCG